MDNFHQELFDVLTRCRNIKRKSKATSIAVSGINKAQMIHEFIISKN